jgi:hypothetical protein
VVITPYVIQEPKQADKLSEEKLRQIDDAADLIREHEIELQRGLAP